MFKLGAMSADRGPDHPSWREAQAAPLPGVEGDGTVRLGRGDLALRTGDHAALIYWSEDELLTTIVPYLVEGLHAGDKVVYVADDLPTARVAAALTEVGVDVEGAREAGRLVLVSSKEAWFPSGRLDVEAAIAGVEALAAQALADGFGRVRLSVEMTYLLADVEGIERGVELEARANDEIFARYPFVCVCSFNGAREVHDVMADVMQTHPVLLRDGVPLANPYYRPWSLLKLDTARLTACALRRKERG